MRDQEPSEQRFARALEAAAAYRAGRDQGATGSLDALLARHPDLRDLLEPLLAEADEPGPAVGPAVAAQRPAPSREPDRFAHFDLLEVLGSGGMGEVYLARDRRLQRTVALKLIQPAALWSAESKARFRREARVVARLDHPSICKLYEAGEHAGWPYLALQLIEGETLATEVARQREAASARAPMTLGPRTREAIDATVATLERVARAVHYAHEQGVVHRDLKPGNIMIAGGEPVVLDFGLARDEHSLDQSLSSSSRPIGTPSYMAPEQIEGGSHAGHQLDRRTDVYALGVILYECLTLERPFDGQTLRELQDRILGSDPLPVDRRNPAVSRDLAVVVGKAMEKSPARRYRTALLLAEDLARVRALEPVLARPVSRLGRAERWTRRNPLVALLLLTLTVALSVSLWQFWRAESNLDQFLAMSDVTIVQDLIREADEELWPPHPDMLPQLADWLARARALEARLAGHRAALSELRERALPLAFDQRRELAELAALRRELDDKRSRMQPQVVPPGSPRPQSSLAEEIADLESRLAIREATLEAQRWQFADPRQRFAHETQADLVRAIEALVAAGSGRLAEIEARQRTAATLAERSLGDEKGSPAARALAAAWREAAARVAGNARFAGFALRPQIGLVPLGPDPKSGLEEFAHLLSGEPAKRDQQGQLRIGDETGIVLVLIPGGSFHMGAQPDDPSRPNHDPMAQESEAPVREVTLDPYLLAKHEMTQGQWLRASGETPSMYRAGDPFDGRTITLRNPVESVTWPDCTRVLRQLGLVLPTEAQWERAARGETDTPWWTGREVSSIVRAANVSDAYGKAHGGKATRAYDLNLDDGHAVHAPVGSFAPNPFGLWDVIGNVSEWCSGWEPGPDRAAAAGSFGKAPREMRYGTRGGSWHEVAAEARSAFVRWLGSGIRYADLGCRPARAMER